jgi:hypothetical protein
MDNIIPFAGSGTTCLAALQEGFHYIGIEKEPGPGRMVERENHDKRL